MNEKFPYGYDLNAYIDKAFEQIERNGKRFSRFQEIDWEE